MAHAAANTRRSTAAALIAVAPAMLKSTRGMPDAKLMRNALHKWGFNTAHRPDAPADIKKILAWVQSNSLPVSALGTADRIRAALDAVSSKLDGKPASATYTARWRAVLWNLCDYAVELGQLDANPIPTVKRSRTKRSVKHVDPATVSNRIRHVHCLQGSPSDRGPGHGWRPSSAACTSPRCARQRRSN